MTKSRRLTPKQALFVLEYLVDFNATQAAIRAGYSEKAARVIGPENLSKPVISAAIAEGASKRFEKVEVTAERVLQELGRLCTSDIRKFFDDSGNLIPITELSDDQAAAVSSIEVVTLVGSKKGRVAKMKLWDKNTALTNLAKHYGLLKELIEHSGTGSESIGKIELVVVYPEGAERG